MCRKVVELTGFSCKRSGMTDTHPYRFDMIRGYSRRSRRWPLICRIIPLSSLCRTCSGTGRVYGTAVRHRRITESAKPLGEQFRPDILDAGDMIWSRGGEADELQQSDGVSGIGQRHCWNWLKAIWNGGSAAVSPLSPLRK